MKKFIPIFLLLTISTFSQTEYISSSNPVYDFLERMETLQIITDYNSFELPKTRGEIAGYLKQIIKNESKLDDVDKKILQDLKVEFEYDLYGSLNNSQSMLGKGEYNILSQKQKYLYYYNEPEKFNLFVNLLGEGEVIFNNDIENKKNLSTSLGYVGGVIRGTILNKFGFYLKGLNGNVFGNKETARLRNDLDYNFKLNEKPDQAFFDETEGYATADFDIVKFKLGQDRINIGYGPVKALLDDNSPKFDYVAFNIAYKFFNFSFFHGKLLGNTTYSFDSTTGAITTVEEKYIGYHRIGFNISKDVNFGIGEFIIYGDRPIDLSYLNPFSFYKSIEHQNRDRDNSILFFDFKNFSVQGLKLYGTLLIDDITINKLGTGWWGNQFLFNAGLYSTNLYKIIPLDIKFEYIAVDPYVFTHRFIRNNFTNFGYNLGSFLQPNSELFYTQANYRFTNRLTLRGDYSYSIHGANPLAPDGSVKENIGGDISLGHRTFDAETVRFLDGFLEYSRSASVTLIYEPVNQINFYFNLKYISQSLQEKTNKGVETFLTLSAEL
ncbi:MAG: capsule assembly Wzi family protein [Ignavibacteriaceae bacterium]